MSTDDGNLVDTEQEDNRDNQENVGSLGDIEEMGKSPTNDSVQHLTREQARDAVENVYQRKTQAERDATPKSKGRKVKEPASKPRSPSKPGAANPKASTSKVVVAGTVKPSKTEVKAATKARQASAQRAANSLKQVSEPTRLFILLTLAESEMHVGAMCDLLGQTQPGVSYHLALLRASRTVEVKRGGKHNFYSLTDEGQALVDVIKPFVEGIVR
jgi:DNA-binding transcriptional ArsR family regulator